MIDDKQYDALFDLAKTVELINFNKGDKRAKRGRKPNLPSQNEFDALIDGDDSIRFDLFKSDCYWGIDEYERIAPNLAGVDLETDDFSDLAGLDKYRNLEKLTLRYTSCNIDEDAISSAQTALLNLTNLKHLVLRFEGMDDVTAEIIEDRTHFPETDIKVEVVRLTASCQKMKAKRKLETV